MESPWKRNPFSMPLIAIAIAVGGLAVHVAGLFWIQVEMPEKQSPVRDEAFVVFLSGKEGALDSMLAEQAALRDPASLFLPTRWNHAADINQVASLQEETELFSSYPPDLTLAGIRLPTPQSVGSVPSFNELVPAEARLDLRGFGRRGQLLPETSLAAAPEIRNLRLVGEAVDTVSGRRQYVSLPMDSDRMPFEGIPDPAVTSHQIVHGRLPGSVQLDRSSGFSDWDLQLLERIDAGYIRPATGDGYWRITWYSLEE